MSERSTIWNARPSTPLRPAVSRHRRNIRAVWSYVEALTSCAEGAASDAIAWARQHTPWLTGPPPIPVAALADGSLIGFLARPGGPAIGRSFTELVDESVDRLIVFSPYWDGLVALQDLRQLLGAARTTVLLDVGTHDYPLLGDLSENIEIIDISSWQPRRFKHAKLIVACTATYDHVVACTATYDHVLTGSANCTLAALGGSGSDGINAEACVYRRVSAGEAVAALDIDELLAMPVVDESALPLVLRTQPIALAVTHAVRPGRFEIEHLSLRWTPPDEVA